jgi:fructose-1,6-bisphosphatase/inositol monophosphatase family enzyme
VPVSVFSLALVVDGVSELGVIYAPFSEHMYTAMRGYGAFLNNRPIRVGETGFNVKARMNVDWWADAEYDVMKSMHRLAYDKNVYILCPGSTTHAGALVARGEFVASVFPGTKGKNVDIAAAKVIIEEAGGKVTDLFGNDQRYDKDLRGAILSNGIVHDEIVKHLREDLGGQL